MSEPDPEGGAKPRHALDPNRPVTMASGDFIELQPTDPLGPPVAAEEFVPAPRTMYAPRPLGLKREANRRRLLWGLVLLLLAAAAGGLWFWLRR